MRTSRLRNESGFSLIELMVATGLLLVVSSIVTTALMQMTSAQKTVWNRTEMHSGIRGATELLQQEVGQAGRITLGAPTTLQTAVVGVSPCTTPVANVTLSQAVGLFLNQKVTILDGDTAETVQITALNATSSPPTISACFTQNHAVGATVVALGGFAEGIIPPSPAYSITTGGVTTTGTYTNGSTKTRLKLFGDINGDGNMVYVEYFCDQTGTHNLYRNVMAYTAASKPAVTDSQILLTNIYPNTNDADGSERPCFKYQWTTVTNTSNASDTHQYVLDVAVTLTVQTQQIDPITKTYQQETKALLNVSPRNVFNTWSLAGLKFWDRVQPTPATITTNLLP